MLKFPHIGYPTQWVYRKLGGSSHLEIKGLWLWRQVYNGDVHLGP